MVRPTRLSVGIGLTNACNLTCAHCYRDVEHVDYISLDQVKTICEHLPVAAMGFGTGENALHPQFIAIVEYLHERGVTLSLASNGYSLMALPDDILRRFNDLEVSIDFVTEAGQDGLRGAGNWALVHQAMARCRKLGVHLSILATMMSANYAQMDGMAALAQRNGLTLRVNAYQAVKTDTYRLTYEQFWKGYRRLFGAAGVINCSEPVVRAAMGLTDVASPCGHTSIRFNQRGQVIPCVYWPALAAAATIEDLPRLGVSVLESDDFRWARQTPPSAAACRCQGGCATRRALNGRLDAHDDYCPWTRGEDIRLAWRPAPAMNLMRARNVCTTIVA